MSPKNGFLTSEFALTALLILCATILISLDKLSIDSLVSLWPLFTSASAYSISRGLAKRGASVNENTTVNNAQRQ